MPRYIDADKLEQELEYGWKKSIKRYDGEMATIFHILLGCVKGTPSADVEKVRHGRWVRTNPLTDTEACSLCDYNILSSEMETPYCPYCGAKMDQEGEEEK